jgi:hypothetical protein
LASRKTAGANVYGKTNLLAKNKNELQIIAQITAAHAVEGIAGTT